MELKDYNRWFTLHYDEFMSAHQANVTGVNEDVGYGKITAAQRVDLSTGESLFFQCGTLKWFIFPMKR